MTESKNHRHDKTNDARSVDQQLLDEEDAEECSEDPRSGRGSAAYIALIQRFIGELRVAGVPVSLSENVDAFDAIQHVDLTDRSTLKYTLGSTLVKRDTHWPAFETLFELYFAQRKAADVDDWSEAFNIEIDDDEAATNPSSQRDSEANQPSDMNELLRQALRDGDLETMRQLARMAIRQYAGMEPGRPVGGRYYLYKTLRNLDFDLALGELLEDADLTDFERRIRQSDLEDRADQIRKEIEAEIRRLLVADRGADAMSRSLRKPLPEDVEFMQASRDEMSQLRQALYPLTRKLAARLARKRKHQQRGMLDFKRTVRQSLSFGGVPAEPRFRYLRPAKPEIFVIADISGSVAAFARFTLLLVHALSSQFSKVRSFVFIDGLDEVTRFFETADDIDEAIYRVNHEADVVWIDGHSDYGHAFRVFWEKYGKEVSPKTTVLILGDARNNYHEPNESVVADVARRARKVFWLNPEPRAYWNTGDSIIETYGEHCDEVFEVRNLRQLDAFVDNLA